MASTSSAFRDLTPYLLYLLLLATLGPLLFGYHLAELNAPSEVITCAKKSIKQDGIARLASIIKDKFSHTTEAEPSTTLPQCIPMNPTQFGLVSSIFTLGGLFGALIAGPGSTRYGSLRTMIYAAAVATIGPIFEAAAPNIGIMTAGRFISGLAAGTVMVVVPIHISEIAPPDRRGFFGSFTQVMTNVGILITQVLGYFLSYGKMWRVILGTAGVIALLQGVGLATSGQESPRWLAENGQPMRAKRALRKIRGLNTDIEPEIAAWGKHVSGRNLADEEETLLNDEDPASQFVDGAGESDIENSRGGLLESMQRPNDGAPRETLGVFAVIRHPHTAPAVFAVVMVMFSQQFTGINSIIMYGVSLLSDLLAANSALLNVAVSGLNVIVTAGAAPLVDKLGRKTCLLMSTGGMGTMSILLAIGIMRSIPILSAVAVVLFVASFGLGLGPIPFILASELVGPEAVGATQSWALAASWIATFVVAQFFPIVNDAMGKGQVYFIFAGFALFFGCFIAWWVPETKGKASADEVWGRKKDSTRED